MSDPPHVDGVRHRWVRARGIGFHVAEAGSGEDVVLCLHGWPQHWYEWRHLLPALADRHRVLALDLRGFGWSDAPAGGYEMEELADDVLAPLADQHPWRLPPCLALRLPGAGHGSGARLPAAPQRQLRPPRPRRRLDRA